jgi:hypothetical protein
MLYADVFQNEEIDGAALESFASGSLDLADRLQIKLGHANRMLEDILARQKREQSA